MLTIETNLNKGHAERTFVEWHVGDPFPYEAIQGVVRITVDGNELQYLRGVMAAHADEAYDYTVNGAALDLG